MTLKEVSAFFGDHLPCLSALCVVFLKAYIFRFPLLHLQIYRMACAGELEC